MLLREPEDHLISNKHTQLLFQFKFGLGETPCDGHYGTGEDSFCCNWAHKGLQVRSKTEGDRLWVTEDRLVRVDGRNELGSPDVPRATSNRKLVGITVIHMHDVGHESQGSQLV